MHVYFKHSSRWGQISAFVLRDLSTKQIMFCKTYLYLFSAMKTVVLKYYAIAYTNSHGKYCKKILYDVLTTSNV